MGGSTYSPHDAGMFFKNLENLLNGEWLGDYDSYTLAKGLLLPLLAAGANLLGLPYKSFEFFLYLATSLGLAIALYRLTGSVKVMLALFVCLAFNPISWSVNCLIFLREPLYNVTSLAVLLGGVWALFLVNGLRQRIVGGILFGVAFGLFWLTREESVWLYPALGCFFLLTVLLPEPGRKYLRIVKGNAQHLAIVLVAAIIGYSAVICPVAYLNDDYYGRFITNEFRSKEFKAFNSALMRIESEQQELYTPVSREAINLAFSVSPAMSELKPGFEKADRKLREGVKLNNANADTEEMEREFSGAILTWALRGAVDIAGHYTSAKDALGFYGQIADEINDACDSGKIPCKAHASSYAPSFPWDRVSTLIDTTIKGWWMIISQEAGTNFGPHVSDDFRSRIALWQNILGQVAPSKQMLENETQIVVRGWVGHLDAEPDLSVRYPGVNHFSSDISLKHAGDVDRYLLRRDMPKMVTRNFWLITNCVNEGCQLEVFAGDEKMGAIPINSLPKIGWVELNPDMKFFVHSIKPYDKVTNPMLLRPSLEDWKLSVMEGCHKVVRIVAPVFWFLALLGVILYLVFLRNDRNQNILVIMAVFSFIALITRAALIGYIATTLVPGFVREHYLMAGYGFSIVFSVIGCYLLIVSTRYLYTVKLRMRNA